MKLNNLSTNDLKLYHFQSCPYCARVISAIKRLGLDIELRDVRKNAEYRQELITKGGKSQVPALRIEHEGTHRWLYESADIVEFLARFATETKGRDAA